MVNRRSISKKQSRSEFDFIDLIKNRALKTESSTSGFHSSPITHHLSPTTHHSSLLQGIGDDAAVIRQSATRDLVITSDLLVENIDFRLEWTTPRLIGHKALAVSLSDIAAMGARPQYALLSIGIPKKIWKTNFVDELYEGFFALAEAHQVTLIGGDVSRTPERVVIDSIVVGEVKRGRAILRSKAKPGDHIFVTGSLGGAAAGLKLFEDGARVSHKKQRSRRAGAEQKLLLRQLKPEPRVAWGVMLGEKCLATAMIDISDGLSSDLAHLCEQSGVGARIDAARIPIDPNILQLRRKDLDPLALALALNGGEDFELLFTVNPRNLKKLPPNLGHVAATYIGDVCSGTSVVLVNGTRSVPLTSAGFKHF